MSDQSAHTQDAAECGELGELLGWLSSHLDSYLTFEQPDALSTREQWQSQLDIALPDKGVGVHRVMEEIAQDILPNGSAIPRPGFTSFITTGATSSAVLASLSASVASPQRYGLTAFNYLEELSLDWLAEMFELPPSMKGVYSSGGSIANIVALGGARQQAFEQVGVDPANEGVDRLCRIYASSACHRTIHRAAAVLGMGRNSVVAVDVDDQGRLDSVSLRTLLSQDAESGALPVAIVANAGATDTGAIDPLQAIGEIAQEFGIWLHVDGAYGLPGILDPECKPLYRGLDLADSVSVDPHKWLGAPVGIGATFVKDRSLLERAFAQGSAHYLEGSFSDQQAEHSMDSLGIPYDDYGLELSAPCRGVVVWALIREIGKQGMIDRMVRHNQMAKYVANEARQHANLELALEPTLSICCFRYVDERIADLNLLNQKIHRQLVRNNKNIPSTTVVNDKLVIRPCFVGARTGWQQAEELVEEVLAVGSQITEDMLAEATTEGK